MSAALLSDPHPGAGNVHVALKFAAAGIAVFPCWEAAGFDARGNPKKAKEPYTLHGFKDATINEFQVRQWWKEHPYAIVGIACGAAGLFVVDCDVKNKNADGDPINGINSYIEIAKKLGIEPTHTATISTPSGGLHSIYAMPESSAMPDGKLPRSSTNAKTGIDTRGDGGYIFAPGSVMADGTRYAAIGPDLLALRRARKLPVMPLGLPDAVRPQKAAGKPLDAPAAAPGPPPSAAAQPPRSPATARELIVAKAALADECTAVAASPSGGRNDRLNIAAHSIGTLIGAAWLDRPTAEGALFAAAVQNGSVADDGEQQARATMRKGIDAGILKPRGPLAANDPPLVAGMEDTVARMIASHRTTHRPVPTSDGQLPATSPSAATIIASPFKLVDPSTIPQRQWLYGKHYIRQFVSATIAPGGLGKSSLVIAEALAMATGRNLIGHQPSEPLRVWLINGEDPYVELERRIAAVALHYSIKGDDIGDRLFINSGRDTDFIIAKTIRESTVMIKPNYDALKQQIISNKIDVLTVDPFISSHSVSENDNNAVDFVVKTWNKLAQETNCAIELVHHARKGNGNETTVDDARGAKALTDAARSVRLLNRMTSDQAKDANIAADKAQDYFRVNNGKANLSRASHGGEWYEVQGVPLKNGGTITVGNANVASPGDSVGVVKSWPWPATASQIEADIIDHVQSIVRGGNYRASEQSPDWVGYVIGSCFGYDKVKGHATNKRAMVKLVAQLISEGWLKVVTKPDALRRDKTFVEVGKPYDACI